jgi:transposase
MLTMYEQITIKTLHKQGVKKSQIARQLGCHRNTINNILERETLSEKQTRVRSSIVDPYKDKIKELHDKDITRVRIHEILSDEYNLHVSYDTLRKYVRKHFPKPIEAFGVQNTAPGEEAELDFGYLGMLPGAGGKPVKTWGLVIVLSYSRVGYYAICYDQKLETLVREVAQAFTYFGGVPKRLKIDNMRTAILQNKHYDLQFTTRHFSRADVFHLTC